LRASCTASVRRSAVLRLSLARRPASPTMKTMRLVIDAMTILAIAYVFIIAVSACAS